MSPVIESLAPLVIASAKQILDALVPGDKISDDAIKAIKAGYCLSIIYLNDVVTKTPNKLDDTVLDEFQKLAVDTLTEAGESVPVI